MDGAVRSPAPRLRDVVAPYVGYRAEGLPPGVHHGLPSTTLTLVVALDEPLDVTWASDPGSRRREWALVSGLHGEPALVRHRGSQHGVQLALSPLAARALLGVPAAALQGELVALRDVVGRAADRLYDEVASAPDWQARFDRLDAGLSSLAGGAVLAGVRAGVRGEVREAWRRLHADPATRVGDLAAELGLSRRHLTATFSAEVGLSPKQVAGLVRFQRSRRLLVQGRRLGDVAATAGYSDQAHLTREWRRMAGRTPGEWRSQELPFVQETVGG